MLDRPALWIFLCLLFGGIPAAIAQDMPSLHLPVDCAIGKDCWMVNYLDTNPQPGIAEDFTCSTLSYDGHDGSDFAIRDLLAMETGVPVVAVMEGKVIRTRDGAIDTMPTKDDIAVMLAEKKGCGNGIVIEHQGGWQSLYCHLKKDSLLVKEGGYVKKGQPLATIGHSGIAEFPHLHFTLLKEGIIYDPFSGQPASTACRAAEDAEPLWEEALPYEPIALYASGFHAGRPLLEALKVDAHEPATLNLPPSTPLTLWALFFGLKEGDKIHIAIKDPQGQIVAEQEITQEKTRIRQMYYVGKNISVNPSGTDRYQGEISVTRLLPSGEIITRTRTAVALITSR